MDDESFGDFLIDSHVQDPFREGIIVYYCWSCHICQFRDFSEHGTGGPVWVAAALR